MFYVSSVVDENTKIGVTDTEDGVEDFFTNKELTKIVKDDKINVYGASYFNYKVTCTVLKPNKTLNSSELKLRLENWKKVHNQWTGEPVENYLAEAKIGTTINVIYSFVGDGDRRQHTCETVLKKIGDDKWSYVDDTNTMSGKVGDSKFAAWALEVSCIYNRLKRLDIG